MKRNTKDLIFEAAVFLFNTKGYAATTVRDIAKKADCNISNIAYYFDNKQGLLEYCFMKYYETYLSVIQLALNSERGCATTVLKSMVRNILQFHSQEIQLSRLILREMSLDSQVVREIMSTYTAKEKYYFGSVLEEGMETGEFRSMSMSYVLIQLKAQLTMPFLNSHYLAEVLHVFAQEPYFIRRYEEEVCHWIDYSLVAKPRESKSLLVSSLIAGT